MTGGGRVEAAARALFNRVNYGNGLTWGGETELTRDRFRGDAQAMLTAADTALMARLDAAVVEQESMAAEATARDADSLGAIHARSQASGVRYARGVVRSVLAAGAGAPGETPDE